MTPACDYVIRSEAVTAILARRDRDLFDLHVKTARGTRVIRTTAGRRRVRASALRGGEPLRAPAVTAPPSRTAAPSRPPAAPGCGT